MCRPHPLPPDMLDAHELASAAKGVLRLRGLPFSATEREVRAFFAGYTPLDVVIARTDGKSNGQAYVLLPDSQLSAAVLELQNKYMGKRWIEVFHSTLADMETARRIADEPRVRLGTPDGQPGDDASALPRLMQTLLSLQQKQQQVQRVRALQEQQSALAHAQAAAAAAAGAAAAGAGHGAHQQGHIIRLRGLPFSANEADVAAFLAPIELPEGIGSIKLARHPDLRLTGEAYVHVRTEAEMLLALKKHKGTMGKRYVEVFPSCMAEMQQMLAQQVQQQAAFRHQQQQQQQQHQPHQYVFAPAGFAALPAGYLAGPAAKLLQQPQQHSLPATAGFATLQAQQPGEQLAALQHAQQVQLLCPQGGCYSLVQPQSLGVLSELPAYPQLAGLQQQNLVQQQQQLLLVSQGLPLGLGASSSALSLAPLCLLQQPQHACGLDGQLAYVPSVSSELPLPQAPASLQAAAQPQLLLSSATGGGLCSAGGGQLFLAGAAAVGNAAAAAAAAVCNDSLLMAAGMGSPSRALPMTAPVGLL